MCARKLVVTSGLVLAAAALVAVVAVFRAAPALGQPERPPEGQAEPGQPPPQFPPEGPGGFQPGGPGPGGPARFGLLGGGPVALTAHGDFVYVVRGNTLYQFAAAELKLIKKVTLEEQPPFGPPGRPPGAPDPGNQPPLGALGQPNRNRPGPWDNDVLVYRVAPDGRAAQLATFERAGVPTVARLGDGRLIAAHQHFPADNNSDFDKVAVRFSSDQGRTWTGPQVIRLAGLPEGMRFPFDPTLVPLPDGRVRLYFTSLKGRRFEEDRPAIYSAVSSNGVDYTFEPGVRFGVEGRPVIDCAVALHQGVFHLYCPDNGAGGAPGQVGDGPREGVGYHATSRDGLNFRRAEDVQIEGPSSWLGNAQSDGKVITFFGTGSPGIWTATSRDGQKWRLGDPLPREVRGADPGAVKLRDGGWLVVATGPPRAGTAGERERPGERQSGPPREPRGGV